jgi:hypothetical protein
MTLSRRLELALQMSDSLRGIVVSGIRNRHPEYSEEQVRLALVRLWLGEGLFRQVYPDLEIAL